MRMGTFVAALFFTASALALVIWFAIPESEIPVQQAVPESTPDPLEVSETGPWPKAVVAQREYNFGRMFPGEEQSYVFTIRNEGDAPLKVVKGDSTCKCTVGDLPEGSIPPGGSVDVRLTWHAEEVMPMFSQTVQIWTNDPDEANRPIRLTIAGTVEELVQILPGGEWHVGNISNAKAAEIEGSVFSQEEFEIQKIESSGETIAATARPLTDEELAPIGATSGYEITVTVPPSSEIGDFSEKLSIHTDLKGESLLTVQVTGTRRGPFQILPRPGVTWLDGPQVVNLGSFKASEGAEAGLLLFLNKPAGGEDVAIEGVETEPDFLKVTFSRDEQFADPDRLRYSVKVAVPPGLPPVARIRKNAGTVWLKTSHPGAEEIKLRVEFVSLGR